MKIIDTEKLEKTLLTNWTNFLDVRKLLAFAAMSIKHEPNARVSNLTISRFELVEHGFILWLECNIEQASENIKATIEAFLANNGTLTHIKN